VAQPHRAARLLPAAGFDWLQALLMPEVLQKAPPLNYADILLRFGYAQPQDLFGLVVAWRKLMGITGAEIVLAGHAPSAILAARKLDIPVMLFGSGFFAPPATHPTPNMRPWQAVPAEHLLHADAAVLASINAVLQHFGKAPLGRLADLFQVEEQALLTFPELDHYENRVGARYWGTLPYASAFPPDWPDTAGPKAFAYLRPDSAHFEAGLQAVSNDSIKFGTQGERVDLALLVDGLQAEREQGITIDVAYRFFATAQRKFVVADTPGHEQYTRNMATGASTAQLAVILVDARKGVLTQTRRHSRIVAMMGIRHVVLAVNKMDQVASDASVFERIDADYRGFAANLGFVSIQSIPLSALEGDNVLRQSENTDWYNGPTLMHHLNEIEVRNAEQGAAFRMPVQWVNRPNADFRGFCGRVAQGQVRPGDRVKVLPAGVPTQVQSIVTWRSDREVAVAGDAITLTLTDAVALGRGDVLVAADDAPEVADQFEARLLWMSEQPLLPGRSYWLKLHTQEVSASVTDIKYREDIDTGNHLACKTLAINEIAAVNLSLAQPVVFDAYAKNRTLGGFILVDKLSFETVAAGMIAFALRRAANIHWQALTVDRAARAASLHQKARCIWFTGLSGTGGQY